ncbi:MAG: hypothetical protein RIT02_1538 [Planctomycetota bacterium]
MRRRLLPVVLGIAAAFIGVVGKAFSQQSFPEQRSVVADLQVPRAESGAVGAGRRILFAPDPARPQLRCALWLPTDWSSARRWPVFVELPGNGGYRDARGDECSGLPEDCNLGYGLTEGRGWIWLCLPFLNAAGDQPALTWWGDAPQHRPEATVQFWQLAVQSICQQFQGSAECVVLAGFSRGAIACNALGLHDDRTAGLWTAFLPCSHYDGVRQWPFPGSDRPSAAQRIRRLNGRPQLILGEGSQTVETERYLRTVLSGEPGDCGIRLHSTGFINHSDGWSLRPCKARETARRWLGEIAARGG